MVPGLGSCLACRSRERPDLRAMLLDLGSPSIADLQDQESKAAGPHQPPHYREPEKDSENIGTSIGKGENGKRSTGGQKIFIGIERELEQGRENTLKTTV
ncbi:hypothetical protein KOW79_019035 [Hemibagrus wyckioides]|uniref:Uncharacterized protein n=1 Tax=Hemibagrus wyckioides TaxID=337641 RepID=A0A9D3NBE9_9TELE|nr:hypothetical protein KOW79_019035 [Hemibagrus wyckioides]